MTARISKQIDRSELMKQYSLILQETLALDGSPVAAAIFAERNGDLGKFRRKITACVMLQIARKGDACYSSGKDILCGAGANLGLGRSSIKDLSGFLVRKEKLFKSRGAAQVLIDSIDNRAPDRGNYLAFSPLEKVRFTPDVVLFVANPQTISRILFLNAYEKGDVEVLHGEPLCSGAIAIPMTTGRTGISFLDMACRKFGRYKPEEMVIGVPFSRLLSIIESIGKSSAGTARPDVSLKLAEVWLRTQVPAG